MKKLLVFSIVLFGGFVFMNFSNIQNEKARQQNDKYEVPENVQAIIDKSCKACHNTNSESEKGKKKLNWDLMKEGYKTYKVIAKLGEIEETISENEMPPEKFLAKHPEKKLTAEEKEIMIQWVKEMTEKLSE